MEVVLPPPVDETVDGFWIICIEGFGKTLFIIISMKDSLDTGSNVM
jgi:hypothetical protein